MVRASGWHDGMNPMHFIIIVREFTAINLAEAKRLLDAVRSGEAVNLCPYQPGTSAAFAEKLLRYSAAEQAVIVDT
jgi:hypothetical protein